MHVLLTILFSVLMSCSSFGEFRNVDIFYRQNDPVAVISYNIRYDNPGDGINAWPNRKDHVADMIKKYDADIAGLQEALKHQIDDLEERLPGYKWVGVGRDDGEEGGEFSPVFYNSERFEVLDFETLWLSETPDVPGSKSWDAAITRIVTRVKFRETDSGREFYVLNTHFDHRGETARLESAKLIAKWTSEIPDDVPFIVTGDFNIRETTEAYGVLRDAGHIFDARYVSETEHQGPTTSSNNWEEMREPETRIDYLFTSEHVQVLSHRILDDRYEGYFPSDHLPVLAEIVLP